MKKVNFPTYINQDPKDTAKALQEYLDDPTVDDDTKRHVIRVYDLSNALMTQIEKMIYREPNDIGVDIYATLTENLILKIGNAIRKDAPFEDFKTFLERIFNHGLKLHNLHAEISRTN